MTAALLDYVRWDAGLRQSDKDGVPHRAYVEASAKRGNPEAIAALEGPPFPEAVEYLWEWAGELVGRSGVGMEGYAPLSFATVESWARLTHRHPTPDDVHALFMLDAVMRHPEPADTTPKKRKDATEGYV